MLTEATTLEGHGNPGFSGVVRWPTSELVPFPRVFRAIQLVLAPYELAYYVNSPKISLTI